MALAQRIVIAAKKHVHPRQDAAHRRVVRREGDRPLVFPRRVGVVRAAAMKGCEPDVRGPIVRPELDGLRVGGEGGVAPAERFLRPRQQPIRVVTRRLDLQGALE